MFNLLLVGFHIQEPLPRKSDPPWNSKSSPPLRCLTVVQGFTRTESWAISPNHPSSGCNPVTETKSSYTRAGLSHRSRRGTDFYRYRKGQGLESRKSPNIFRLSFRNCKVASITAMVFFTFNVTCMWHTLYAGKTMPCVKMATCTSLASASDSNSRICSCLRF